ASAVETKTSVGYGEGRIIVIDRLVVPNLCPVPSVFGSFGVFDHHSPVSHRWDGFYLILGRGRGVLFLDDHGTVRHSAFATIDQPLHHFRRVVNLYRRMNTVGNLVEERAGVSQTFVSTPVQLHVFTALQKLSKHLLKLRQFCGQIGARQRQLVLLPLRTRRCWGWRWCLSR